MTAPTVGIVIRPAPRTPIRPLSTYDSAVTRGELLRCECGRLYQLRLKLGRTFGVITAASADPSHCDACQPLSEATP